MAAKATARNLDFSNVKEAGNFNSSRIPAGDYLAIITKVEDAVTKTQKDSWIFSIKIKERPSSVFRYQCLLEEKSLWKVRNLAVAAGKTVPKRRLKLDPNSLVGKLIGVTVEDAEDYNDKEQSEIVGVFPAADMGDSSAIGSDDEDDMPEDDEDDDDIVPGPRFSSGDDDEDEADDEEDEADDEEDDEEPEADRLAGLSRAELKAEIISLQSDFQARKSQSDDDLRDVLRGLLEAEDEEEEEEPEPVKKAPAKKSAAKKKAPVDDDDLSDLDIDNL